jgi:hypothetical protein
MGSDGKALGWDGNIQPPILNTVEDRGTLGRGDSIINAFLATFAGGNPAWIKEITLIKEPADLEPGKKLGHSNLVGYYSYRPKTIEEMDRQERMAVLNDPRLRGFIATLRRPVDPVTSAPQTAQARQPVSTPPSKIPETMTFNAPATPTATSNRIPPSAKIAATTPAAKPSQPRTTTTPVTEPVEKGSPRKVAANTQPKHSPRPTASSQPIPEGEFRWQWDHIVRPEVMIRLIPEEMLRPRPTVYRIYE